MRRVFAYILTLCLCLSFLPYAALAEAEPASAEPSAPEAAASAEEVMESEAPASETEEPEASDMAEPDDEEELLPEEAETAVWADEAEPLVQDGDDEQVTSGRCGAELMWSCNDGTLLIYGEGAMSDYSSSSPAPWSPFAGEITVLELSEGVTSIGKYAFNVLSGITMVTIPEGVTRLGDWCFANCSALVTVTLPMSVTSIGARAFRYDTKIADVYYIGAADAWSAILAPGIGSDNGTLTGASRHYMYDASGVCGAGVYWGLFDDEIIIWGRGEMSAMSDGAPWAAHAGQIVTATVEPGVQSIGAGAFSGITDLTGVSLPIGLTQIGDGAFSGCTALSNVSLPLFLTAIGEEAFSGCAALAGVELPERLKEIGARAFSGCTSIERIALPSGLTSVEDGTLSDCTSLARVDLPGAVTEIGAGAFTGCAALTDVYYDGAMTAWESVSIASGNEPLENAQLHCTLIGGGDSGGWSWSLSTDHVLTVTGEGEMEDYSEGAPWSTVSGSIRSIVLSEGALSVGAGAFSDCAELVSASIPAGVEVIGAGAFSGCAALEWVELPQSLERVEASAFSGCGALADVCYTGTAAMWAAVTRAAGNEPLESAMLLADEMGEGFSWSTSDDGRYVTITGEGRLSHGAWGSLSGRLVLLDRSVSSLTSAAAEGLRRADAVLIRPDDPTSDCRAVLTMLRGLGLENAYALGDANGDGETRADDISAALRSLGAVTDGASARFDVNCDGYVSNLDARYMAEYAVSSIGSYPTDGGIWW